ncbi:hypothetical protein N665_0089s0042 [Sinapis alba]|nr:hypothetical protein N665_0089s0042 [Sinapis alba]
MDVAQSTKSALESALIPSAASEESKVFYLKMKSDYYRYLAEFKFGKERDTAADNTLAAYEFAQAITMFGLANVKRPKFTFEEHLLPLRQ